MVKPYRKLSAALRGHLVVRGLATPIKNERPWQGTPTNGTLVVDHLSHFLQHAAELYP